MRGEARARPDSGPGPCGRIVPRFVPLPAGDPRGDFPAVATIPGFLAFTWSPGALGVPAAVRMGGESRRNLFNPKIALRLATGGIAESHFLSVTSDVTIFTRSSFTTWNFLTVVVEPITFVYWKVPMG